MTQQTSASQNPNQNPNPGKIKFFAKREKIYPRRVNGRYRKLKWLAMIVTLAIYYLAPFLRWDRGEYAPSQAILIDLPSRRAYWFFIEIWPQEVYYLTAILIFAAIGLFFATSLLGRVWCGYFCPQTVWTDLFIWVERIVQGDRNARKRLDQSPWGFEKIWKKGLTHLIWVLIGLFTAGAFVFYFNDAPTLWADILRGDVSGTVLAFVAGLTFSTYLMAGFAREQVCTYMCPYARFQSGMFDKDTLIIGYDQHRGEPRGSHKKGESWDGRGHCIDCTACVQVCPAGIDIRNGLQMECIACGLCVDACDEIMDKVGLPRGLIRYDTEGNLENAYKSGKREKIRFVRPRTIYYALVLSVLFGVVTYSLLTRSLFDLHVLHDRNPLFVTLSDGSIRNGYEVKILNKQYDPRLYAIEVSGVPGAEISVRAAGNPDVKALEVAANAVGHYHVFVSAPAQENDRVPIHFTLRDNETGHEDHYESIFISRRSR